jgi:hypothetical protein
MGAGRVGEGEGGGGEGEGGRRFKGNENRESLCNIPYRALSISLIENTKTKPCAVSECAGSLSVL